MMSGEEVLSGHKVNLPSPSGAGRFSGSGVEG